MSIPTAALTGRTQEHVIPLEGTPYLIHREAIASLLALKARAAKDGFDLRVASAFRDHASQLRIWNAKATGKRPLLDVLGTPLMFDRLTAPEILTAILRWSALPGASRHHWGTELDVYDAKSLPADYTPQLTPQEAASGGVLREFSRWLGAHIASEGFFRPYERDLGGVSPEWWHISFAPVSTLCFDAYSLALLEQSVRETEIELKAEVLRDLPGIYQNYVRKITHPSY